MSSESSVLDRISGAMLEISVRVIIIAAMVLALFVGAKYCFSMGFQIFYQEPMEEAPGHDVDFVIKEDADAAAVAAALEEEGLIKNDHAFMIAEKLYNINIYPGTYQLNTSMTVKEMLEAINLTEDEYEERLAEEAASAAAESEAAATADPDVLGGGSDLVDEGQAEAAAAAGIQVETEAASGGA